MNKTIGCFDIRTKNSYSINVYDNNVHSLIKVKTLSSPGIENLNLTDIMFIFNHLSLYGIEKMLR